MSRTRLWIALLVALALGTCAGYLVRRWRAPTLEERAQEAAEDLRKAADRFVK